MDEIKKESVKCSECGKFFNKDFGMCPFCGAELEDENVEFTDNQDAFVSANGTEEVYAEDDAQSKFVLCPKCGNYYDENVGLCIHCGYSVFESDEDAEESKNADNFDSSPETASDKPAYNDSKMKKTINYKKIGIIAAVVVCVVIVLSVVLSSPKRTGVSTNQIETDISQLSEVANGIDVSSYTPLTPYTVTSVEIKKRQTNIEDKEDIVYCNVVMSNEYYECKLDYELIYYYYDEGGWILQHENCIDKITKPIAAIKQDQINEISVKVNDNTYKLNYSNISNINFVDGSVPCSTIEYKYNDGFVSFSGTKNCFFENGTWQYIDSSNFQLDDFDINWSSELVPKTYSSNRFKTTYPKMKYYRSAEDKNREYHIYVANDNIYFNFTIDSITNDTVKGKFTVTAIDTSAIMSEEKFPTIKNNISESFQCKFNDIEKGSFEIIFSADLFSYHYMGGGFIDPCYTSADVKAKIEYDFEKNEWHVDNLEIVSLNLSSEAIIVG